MPANGYEVSLGSDEHVVMVVQLCDYTKSHILLHSVFTECILYTQYMCWMCECRVSGDHWERCLSGPQACTEHRDCLIVWGQ